MTTEAAPLWTPPGYDRATGMEIAEKAAALADLGRSVIATPPGEPSLAPLTPSFILWVGQQADSLTPWGAHPKIRDRQLRSFYPSENILASAVATCAARNAAWSWKVSGDEATAEAAAAMLNNANMGAGFEDFILQLSTDLYTTDTGAFVEFMRAADSPDAPVVGLNNLDSLRCHPTGNPQYPVIYEDTNGRFHRMPWYSVVQLLEMPSPATLSAAGFFYRIQMCAVSRVMRAAQVMRDITIYKDEKVSGRFLRALHLISGVDDVRVRAAMDQASAAADQRGLQRYVQPAIVGSVDPRAEIKHDTIELASLPDGFSEEDTTKNYILTLALAFLEDYQTFAPLPGGNLGTSTQSHILHAKARGRGPGLFQKLILRLMNQNGALPANVLFEYDDLDLDAEEVKTQMASTRATERSVRVASGELDAIAARQIALEAKDLTQAQYDELLQRDEERKAQEDAAAQQEAARLAAATQPNASQPGEGADPSTTGNDASVGGGEQPAAGARAITALDEAEGLTAEDYASKASPDGVPFGQLITSRLHRAYSDTSDDTTALGYFESTEQRIEVANAIGPALALFEDALREAGVYDMLIGPEDADRIMEASTKMFAELLGERVAATPALVAGDTTQERLDYEAEAAGVVEAGLAAARRIVERQLRGQRDEQEPKAPPAES